jgi:predicted phage-related endonuclease
MKIIECTQGEPEWHAARCGKVTASRVADIVRKTKTGVSASRNTYMGELVAERLSGFQAEGFTSAAMQFGKDNEAAAREMYAFASGATLRTVGFIDHHTIEWAGFSPDALVGDAGLIEIKCPNSATHIATLLGAPIDPDYVKQMQWAMACTKREWCDWVSFDPRMPPEMQLHVRPVNRDPVLIAELESETRKFLAEVDATIAKLTAAFRQQAAE